MAFDVAGALKEGYTHREIAEHLAAQRGFDLAGARQEGYSDEEIVSHLKREPKQSGLRQVADVPLNVAKGAVSGVRMISDMFGADNVVSKGARTVENYLGALMSAQSKKDSAEVTRILKDAEDKGILDQVIAGAKAFGVAPVDLMANALGTMAPVVVGAMGSGALGVGAAGARLVGAGIGAGMGAGVVKGTIYEDVKTVLTKAAPDMPPEQIEARAQLAQAYGGKNLDQILLGTALGGVAASVGIERSLIPAVVNRVLGRAATETAAKEAPRAILRAGAVEAVPEFAQGAQERIAGNIAQQREGFAVPTMRGAVSSGTMEGLAGLGLGSGIEAVRGRSQADIDAELAAKQLQEQQAAAAASAAQEQQAQQPAQGELFDDENYDVNAGIDLTGVINPYGNVESAPEVDVTEPQLDLFRTREEPPMDVGQGRDLFTGERVYQETPAPVVEEAPAAVETPFATVLTPEVLASTGLKPQSAFFKQLAGKDMADPEQQKQVADVLIAVRQNPKLAATTKQAIERVAMQAYGALTTQEEIAMPAQGPTKAAKKKRTPKVEEAPIDVPPFQEAPANAAPAKQPRTRTSVAVPSVPVGTGLDAATPQQSTAPVGAGVVPAGSDAAGADVAPGADVSALTTQPDLFAAMGMDDTATPQPTTTETPSAPQAAKAKQSKPPEAKPEATPAPAPAVVTEEPPKPKKVSSLAELGKLVPPTPDEVEQEWLAKFDEEMLAPEQDDGGAKQKAAMERMNLPKRAVPSEGAAVRDSVRRAISTKDKKEYARALSAIAGAELAPSASKKATAKTEPVANRVKAVAKEFLDTMAKTDPKGVAKARQTAATREAQMRRRVEAKEKAAKEEDRDLTRTADAIDKALDAQDEADAAARAVEERSSAAMAEPARTTLPTKQELADIGKALKAAIARGKKIAKSQAVTPKNKSTVESIGDALRSWFIDPIQAAKRVTIVQKWTDLPAAVQEAAKAESVESGRVQAFVLDGKAYLVADNIAKGDEVAVFMHEVGAHIGMTDAEVTAASNRIRLWATAKEGTKERAVYDAAKARMEAAGETSDSELVAYATEEAVKAGVTPRAIKTPKTLKDVRSLQDLVDVLAKMFSDGVRKMFGSGVVRLKAQDLVDLTYGAARASLGQEVDGKAGDAQFSIAPTSQVMLDSMDPALRPAAQSFVQVTLGQHPTLMGAVKATIDSAIRKTRTRLVDKMATIEEKFAAQFNYAVRDSLGNINPMLQLRQAEDANKLLLDFYLTGGLSFDQKNRLYRVVAKPGVRPPAGVFELIQQWAAAEGKTFAKAKQDAGRILEAVRLNELRKSNKQNGTEFVLHMKDPVIDQLMKEYNASPQLQEMNKLMDESRKALVDNMVEAGRITKEMGDEWKAAVGYVPFDREGMDSLDSGLRNKQKKAGRGLAQLGRLPELKGSIEREVSNAFDNYINTLGWMVNQTVRNAAVSNTLQQLTALPAPQAKKLGNNYAAVRDAERTVATYVDGEKVFYELPSAYDAMAFNSQNAPLPGIFRMLGQFSNLLRTAVTVVPTFSAKQVAEDIQRAAMHSGVRNVPRLTQRILSNFASMSTAELKGQQHPAVRVFGSLGLTGEIDWMAYDPASSLMKDLGLEKRHLMGSTWLGAQLHKLDGIVRSSDLAVRKAIYDQTLEETKDELLAEQRAREIINFRRRGADWKSGWVGIMVQTIPFFNAYLQGMDVTYRSLVGKGAASGVQRQRAIKLFYTRAAIATSIATLYALGKGDDDDYDKMSPDKRDKSWVLGNGVAIPVPTELGMIFKAIPERVLEYFRREGTPEEQAATEAIKSYFHAGFNAYFGRTIPIPQGMKPFVEVITNHSFLTGRELEGIYLKKQEAYMRTSDATSELAKAVASTDLARAITDFTKATVGVEISPIAIDTVLNGYFGTTAAVVTGVTDAIVNPDKADRPIHKYVGFAPFTYDPVGTRPMNEFYDLANKIQRRKATIDALMLKDMDAAKEYFEAHKDELAIEKMVSSALEQLSKSRAYKNYLQTSKAAEEIPDSAERRDRIEKVRQYEQNLVGWVRQVKAKQGL